MSRWEAVLDAEAGGRVASLVLDGHELLVRADDPLPDGRPGRAGDHPTMWGCYVMAPWAGRIRHGRLEVDGARHQLPLREPPHALHGTVLDQAWRPTTGDLPRVVLHEGGFASCVVEVDDRWPFGGTTVRHEVSVAADEVRLDLTVAVREPQPVFVGWHPWFRRTIAGEDVAVDLRAEGLLVRDDDGMPGDVAPTTGHGPYDDAFVGVRSPVALRWGDLAVDVHADAPAWVVYTLPRDAVCVEPQSAPPNAVERGEAHLVTPEAPLRFGMRLTAPAAA